MEDDNLHDDLTIEEIFAILEEELNNMDSDDSYTPLDFNDEGL